MFFRNTFTKSGRAIQLVESFRDNEGRPRQRTLLSMGDAAFPQHLWSAVAAEVQNRLGGTSSFLPLHHEIESWVERILRELERKKTILVQGPIKPDVKDIQPLLPVIESPAATSRDQPEQTTVPSVPEAPPVHLIQVDPAKISHRHTTELGPELVVLRAWDELKIDALLKTLNFNARQTDLALLSVANRLINPCTEHAIPDWIKTTSFPDLLQHRPKDLIDDHFYRITDLLLKHKNQIELSLAAREQFLFSLQRTIYLYDTSNTYFEGAQNQNPKAQRSKNSKEKRTDAKQIAFGLVLDDEGFVIQHQTFPGNMHDSPTLEKIIKALEETGRCEKKPMIVMDSGFSGEQNLQMLRENGYNYIAVGRRPTRLAYEKDFNKLSFKEIAGRESKEPVSVAFKDEKNERIVLCHSEARGEKEKAILSNAENRFLKDIEKFTKRLAKGGLKKEASANQALGKIRERHPRVARYYELSISSCKTGKHILHCGRIDEEYIKAERLCGSYYMRCSRKDLSDNEIWKLYMMLTRVETGFKSLKSDLGLRPVFHHREDRCDSHIFITVLAYRILHWIEYTLRKGEDKRSWPTIRRILQTHCHTTITCPSQDGDIHHIRIPGTPDLQQIEIYDALGVDFKKLSRNSIVSQARSRKVL